MRSCSECNTTFAVGQSQGRKMTCSPACSKKRHARNNRTNRNPMRVRNQMLMREYGITQDQYNLMMVYQSDRCAGCDTDQKGNQTNGNPHRYWAVDHDHATGEVRGLLCHSCNKSAGLMDDDPENLRALADYLEGVRK